MTHTTEASAIKVGDELRDRETFKLASVIEVNHFRRGTRVHVRTADGIERTFVSATTVVINRSY